MGKLGKLTTLEAKPLEIITELRYNDILMIRSFSDQGTEDIFHEDSTKHARQRLPSKLHKIARRKLDMLNAADKLDDLRAPPSNRLEQLKGNRRGQCSIRINDQYRIAFTWSDSGADEVEIVDYH